ncbi:MAG: J domain-containing protein [Ardenticatenaceae bacterium]
MNYYEALDIPPSATPEEIRKAYRELVEIYHPDRMQDRRSDVQERAESRLKLINEAYAVLRDPEERTRYDAALGEQSAEGSIYFKPKGSSSVARTRIRERIEEIKAELITLREQIESLKPRLEAQAMLDQRWDRYILVSFVLAWPFIFWGVWVSFSVWLDPLSSSALGGLLLLLLLGYFCLLMVALASRSNLRQVGLQRLLASVPLAILLFVSVILIRLSRGFHIAILILGYSGILWKTIGQPLAEERSAVLVAGSKIKQLEEEITAYHVEKQHLEAELGRH